MITDTIQNALKRLFCSIGGNADNVRNKDDINAILDEMTALRIGEEIADAGTTVIANPTLAGTEADLTGLQVGDTKYKVGGGGGGVLVVTVTYNDGEDPYYIADKTAGEIVNAAANGGVIFKEVAEDGEYYSSLVEFTVKEDGYTFGGYNSFSLEAATASDYPRGS